MGFSDDDILLKNICAGDEKAFAEFYLKYFTLVKSFTFRYVKDPDMAEDLAQEIFIKIWNSRLKLDDIRSLKSYLFIVSRNYTFSFLKKASEDKIMKDKIIVSASSLSNSAEDKLVSEEYFLHLRNILSTLPLQTQHIFKLCREEEKSYQEVSALLGISKDTVKKHMVRSMKAFKLTLQNSLDIFFFLITSIISTELIRF